MQSACHDGACSFLHEQLQGTHYPGVQIPYVRARFAQGHPEELIKRLRSLATPSKQLINTLLRLLRDHAAINKRFAHDIAQAFAKLLKQLAHALAHAAGQLPRPCRTCWSIK